MASQWETIAVPFQGGIDTKSDGKAAPPTKLVELENGIFTKRGSLRKRHGYDLVDAEDTDGTAVAGEALSSAGDELILTTGENLYAYDPIGLAWKDQGDFTRSLVTSKEVETDTEEQSLGDRADYCGVTVRVWESTKDNSSGSAAGVRVAVSNTATGTRYNYFDVPLGSSPRCVRISGRIHVVYALSGSTDLATIIIDPENPEDASASDAITFISDAHADAIFDIVTQEDGEGAIYAYYSTDTQTLKWGRLLQSGTTEQRGESASTGVVDWISVAAGDTYIQIGYYDSTAPNMYSYRFTEPNGPFDGTEEVASTNSYTPIRGTTYSAGVESGILYEESWSSSPENGLIGLWSDDGGAGVDIAEFLRHSSLASNTFTHDGNVYFWCRHESTKGLQNSYFLVRIDDDLTLTYPYHIVGRIEYQTAAPLTTETRLPAVAAGDDSKYTCVLPYQRKLDSQWDDVFNHQGLKEVAVELGTKNYSIERIGKSSYVPGGIAWNYSGINPTESGFLLYPEPDIEFGSTDPEEHTAVDVGTAGSAGFELGVYGYRIYYEWTNMQGERFRSSAISFAVDTPGAKKVKITIPTLLHTNRLFEPSSLSRLSDVAIVVYRTKKDDQSGVHYRISDTDPSNDTITNDNPYAFNNPEADTIVFIDNLPTEGAATSPADYESLREIDPLTGGVIDSVAPPACELMISAKRRLFIAGGEINPNRVLYSKLRVEGEPVEFNDTLYFDLPHIGGAVTGFAELNDNLIVFKRTHIYVVTGDGPSNTNFGTFQEPAQLTTDVGCIDHRSVVEIPQGIMFQSEKGIYLVGNDFQITYIGAEAEGFNDQNIVSADVLSDDNTVVFLSDDGTTLTYDHFHAQWGTFTPHTGFDATVWDGKYCYARANSEVYIENETTFKDGNVPFKLRLKTAPLRMGDLQEYWRCKRIYVLAGYYTPHSLRMHVWYNRDTASGESCTWDPADFIEDEKWGDNDTWGSGETWGGALDSYDYQVSYAPARQKVQSISLEFEEVPGDTPGRSFELTELALMWAPKTGLGRLAASRRK